MDNLLFVATGHGLLTFKREGETWHEIVRGLTGRRVTSVSTRESATIAGTTEGIFRSDDLGQTWQMASAGLATLHIRWLAYHPEVSALVFAGTEPATIFVSSDGAETWRECPEVAKLRDELGWYLPYSPEAGCVRGFAFHGSRAYAAVEQGGLLRSDDSGETWRLAEGSNGNPHVELPESFIHPDVHSVAVHPSSPDLVFAPTGRGFYRSTDGGKTWVCLYDCYCRAVWLDPADPNQLILGPADSVDLNGRIEETVDGGRTWRPALTGLQIPWQRHMVERFVRVGGELLAVLSNGHLLAAPLATLTWRRILPQVTDVTAVTPMQK